MFLFITDMKLPFDSIKGLKSFQKVKAVKKCIAIIREKAKIQEGVKNGYL